MAYYVRSTKEWKVRQIQSSIFFCGAVFGPTNKLCGLRRDRNAETSASHTVDTYYCCQWSTVTWSRSAAFKVAAGNQKTAGASSLGAKKVTTYLLPTFSSEPTRAVHQESLVVSQRTSLRDLALCSGDTPRHRCEICKGESEKYEISAHVEFLNPSGLLKQAQNKRLWPTILYVVAQHSSNNHNVKIQWFQLGYGRKTL